MQLTCPLCSEKNTKKFHQDKHRQYFQCQLCHLIFVPPDYFLSPQDEKTRYDLHQNNPNDTHYRQFLSRLFNPLQKKLKQNSQGLDFGSGPGPTLSIMFKELGHTMAIYDCFYANNPEVFTKQYDFITATEVVEHLHKPWQELQTLWGCLKPGGYLGIMTKLALNKSAFSTWHYKNDPTHVCFFSEKTFEWLAKKLNAQATFIKDDVVLLQKHT